MALWQFQNLNKYGNFRTRIIHTKGSLGIPGDAFGPVVFTRRFRYEYKHSYMPPFILKMNGKTYLMPLWQEVHPETTIEDINWIKPKPKPVQKREVIKHTFESATSGSVYTTREYHNEDGSIKYTCNCPGVWRSKEKKCKHIKSLENGTN